MLAVNNKIATAYDSERNIAGKMWLKCRRLHEIITENKRRNRLPNGIFINKKLLK